MLTCWILCFRLTVKCQRDNHEMLNIRSFSSWVAHTVYLCFMYVYTHAYVHENLSHPFTLHNCLRVAQMTRINQGNIWGDALQKYLGKFRGWVTVKEKAVILEVRRASVSGRSLISWSENLVVREMKGRREREKRQFHSHLCLGFSPKWFHNFLWQEKVPHSEMRISNLSHNHLERGVFLVKLWQNQRQNEPVSYFVVDH